MNERMNTLESQGINGNIFTQIYEKLVERKSLGITRQSIEKANFAFDYEGEDSERNFEIHKYQVPGRRGKYSAVRIPICNEHAEPKVGLIDWVNFTFKHEQGTPGAAIFLVSDVLEDVLGYGITSQRDRGLNSYEESYILGNYWGFVCVGGQSNTIMVSINGEGCVAAREGWEERLYNLANILSPLNFRLTRVDVAHDLFDGEYNVDNAVKDYDDGLFSAGGRTPKIQQYGNWRIPDDTNGRTVYLGARKSGKYCRIYEKGKQLGEKHSPWVRIECEWRNKNREIPYDILIEPGRYLAGAYPAFFWLSKTQSRIKTKTNRERLVYDKAVEIAKHQLGGLILLMTMIEKSAEDIVKKIVGTKISKRYISPDWQDPYKIICTT